MAVPMPAPLTQMLRYPVTAVVGLALQSTISNLFAGLSLQVDRTIGVGDWVHVGERITSTTVIESISDEKKTRFGPGHFLTWVTTYRDDAGEVVGRQLFRFLKFKPEAQG